MNMMQSKPNKNKVSERLSGSSAQHPAPYSKHHAKLTNYSDFPAVLLSTEYTPKILKTTLLSKFFSKSLCPKGKSILKKYLLQGRYLGGKLSIKSFQTVTSNIKFYSV